MKRIVAFVVPLAALALAAAPGPDWEALVREGNAAFAGGDYERAAALYLRAEPRATDPRKVAYNLAAARLRQAEGGGPEIGAHLSEAEALFRCCDVPGDPRRGRALVGLGNCLLLKAGTSDGGGLNAAIKEYERALREPTLDDAGRDDAGHNLQRARLLLLQLRLTKPEPPPEHKDPGGNDEKPPERPKDRQPEAKIENGANEPGAKPQTGEKPVPVPAKAGAKATATDDQGPGGAANRLPDIPDGPDQPPLAAQDAAAHLELAARRVWQERQQHREGKVAPASDRLKNW